MLRLAFILLLCFWAVDASLLLDSYKHYKLTNNLIYGAVGHPMKDYLGYGNYCGLGGSGPVVDPIDNCCRIHDLCYNKMSLQGCPSVHRMYQVGIRTGTNELTCDGEKDFCARGVCICDFHLVVCMKKYDVYYDKANLKRTGSIVNLVKYLKNLGKR